MIVTATREGCCNALKACGKVMALRGRAMPLLNVHERKETPKVSTRAGKVGITIEEILQERCKFVVMQMSM